LVFRFENPDAALEALGQSNINVLGYVDLYNESNG